MITGKLIVFEGADEVGKTTLATMLAEALRSKGTACKLVGFPGNQLGTLGRHIYELHHDPTRFRVGRINPTSLQLLHVAAHIDTIDQEIIPALKNNQIVVLDRFWWSSWIYGIANRANKASLKACIRAEAIHWKGVKPSWLFLVTCSSPFEKQADIVKWRRIDRLYKEFASQEKQEYPLTIIQNDSTPEMAFSHIQKYAKTFSPGH